LDLAVRERHKAVALEKVKDALAEQVHDDADVASVVEAVPEVDTPVPVFLVIGLERGEDSEFYPRGVPVFLH